ncbi:hypothetical protein FRUB_06926 [Fimbriiglobus ruber]|uniref:Uncharacterized protein n=1 Tax=Fimbriiglobus ruber TaxID=1908690 RepID=A0A225DK32_9BACT|nr:hypothetical protein FRUB_06926 [Fimbriiglobus ruber]
MEARLYAAFDRAGRVNLGGLVACLPTSTRRHRLLGRISG